MHGVIRDSSDSNPHFYCDMCGGESDSIFKSGKSATPADARIKSSDDYSTSKS